MERIALFLDYANINAAGPSQMGLNYRELLDYLSEGRFLIESYAYVPVDPRNEHGRDGAIEQLWADGFMVNSKVGSVAGDTYKCDFDVEITMDLMRTAHLMRPDIVVLCSGDADFLPVVHELRRLGVRVEIASFERSASRKLTAQSSGFISLDQWLTRHNEVREPLFSDRNINGLLADEGEPEAQEGLAIDRDRNQSATHNEMVSGGGNIYPLRLLDTSAAPEE
ncbi:MAG: NYN domain-containing protein [Geobacteraceae bacterium]|nr:NYN domain-containing protein [Geobacteraceae bacterium]